MSESDRTRKFLVTSEVTISVTGEVFAASHGEALELARALDMGSLCRSCTAESDGCWVASELDGEVMFIVAKESE